MKYGGFPMKKDSVRFTVCIHKELFERLDYVSQFYGCSKSHELLRMIERELVQFERTYGTIPERHDHKHLSQY